MSKTLKKAAQLAATLSETLIALIQEMDNSPESDEDDLEEAPKRGRGRPPKSETSAKKPSNKKAPVDDDSDEEDDTPKRGPGRARAPVMSFDDWLEGVQEQIVTPEPAEEEEEEEEEPAPKKAPPKKTPPPASNKKASNKKAPVQEDDDEDEDDLEEAPVRKSSKSKAQKELTDADWLIDTPTPPTRKPKKTTR